MVEQRNRRRHTGRRRNEQARTAILHACLRLVREGEPVTMDAIARAAGVGKQTLYRWWPSKEAVLGEAMAERAHVLAGVSDTGTVRQDLATFLADTFAAAAEPANRRMLRQVMAGAQQDHNLGEAVAEFTATRRRELHTLLARGQQRGELPTSTDLNLLVDQAYGFLWYRLLIGHAPLDHQAAHQLADNLIAAAAHR